MNNPIRFTVAMLLMAAATVSAKTADYTTFLTTERGFTEVKSTDGFTGNANDYYILVPAETHEYIVGIGRYERKPGWASEDSKALRYKSAETDPALVLSNFFTIEKTTNSSPTYIGFRNVVYSADMFQTHKNAGYMYVNTFSDKNIDEWSYLIPHWQNDGYWLFENGKYPMSSEADEKGYMGSWTAGRFAVDEPIALNRRNTSNDPAGHYRLFHIAKADYEALYKELKRTQLLSASTTNPVDATWLITNPSFETGDETGWTLHINPDQGAEEVKVCDFGMSSKEGGYLMNVYQWWSSSLSVSQTVENVLSGKYTLSGVVCTWADRTAFFSGNDVTVNKTGIDDATGIPVSLDVIVGIDSKLTITAGSTAQWWNEGHGGETQTFFKLDNVQLTCKQLYLDGMSLPLPNNDVTLLTPNQWYYYDVTLGAEYVLVGPLDGLVYSTDGDKPMANISINSTTRKMELAAGRYYFKTNRSDATLYITSLCTVNEGTFTAVALNVDGLPNKILTYNLNEDGPGESGTKKISKYLASKGYDFIGCSEDFNYNGALMESLSGSYSCGAIRKTLSVGGLLGGFPFDTDGLNLIWKNSKISATNESWTRWNETTSTDGNQYVKKGYRHYDVLIDGGALIDVFILHMDAGDASVDSRHSQWEQLAGAINAADATRPKLVIGDTNSRWTREEIASHFLNKLNSNLGASDVWVEKCRNNVYPTTAMGDITDQSDPTNFSNYEVVDKIFYINPKAANTVQLQPQSFKIENDYTYDYVDHDGNTKALGDHRPVVVEFKWMKSGDAVNMPISLADNADNSKTVCNTSGILADVTLQGRTLYKDGFWNTLCLPFNAELTGDLAGAELKELDVTGKWAMVNGEWTTSDDGHKTGLDGNTLYLNFKDATSITAGTPYIIKWGNGNHIVNPQFTGVTISGNDAKGVTSTDQKVTFQGTYSPVILASDQSELYLGADDKLYWPGSSDFKVNAFRAYFTLSGAASGAREFVLNFGGVASGISATLNDKGEMRNDKVYDLQGRSLGSQPTKAGLYISNGKKILVK